MSELVSQIFQALSSRLRSPFVGYFILAQVYLNYSAFFLLFWGTDRLEWRITVFEANSGFEQFVVVPATYAILGGIVAPWITLAGAWVAKVPAEKLKKLQMGEARKLRIHDYKQAAEELQAEAEFNSNKVAVAESLKRAEEVGGEELVEDIKAGPRSTKNDEENSLPLEDDLYVASGYVASESISAKVDAEDTARKPINIMNTFEDFWDLRLPELIVEIPQSFAGRVG